MVGKVRITRVVEFVMLFPIDFFAEAWPEDRRRGSQEANAEVLDQCDFELAVAHLHVPELV